MIAAIAFWVCAGLIAYTYAVYPMLLILIAARRGHPRLNYQTYSGTISVIMAVHNEKNRIAARARELLGQLADSGNKGEIIIVSDGSTDGTPEVARGLGGNVRLIELTTNVGKAAALNHGREAARGEILAFADARQYWAPGALRQLVSNFVDPAIGAVSGDLIIEAEPGVTAGVGLYWRYEKMIRRLESRTHSMVGVTGAICAVRRELFELIPPGTILDDVYWPMRVAMRGFRVIHDESALAYDRLPARPRDEFRRKVRTLCGNYQLTVRLPSLLLPWRNPICWQFVSHKILRLVVPWALLILFATSALVPSPIYRLAFGAQSVFYLAALAGSWKPIGRRSRLMATAAAFVVLNVAAMMALWLWVRGQAARTWNKVAYETLPPPLLHENNSATSQGYLRASEGESATSTPDVGA